MIEQLLQRIASEKIPCYFISPHLDDAVFSAGSLIARLSHVTSVTVITVFTEYSTPLTLSARQFLRQMKSGDPKELFRLRREEDIAACTLLNSRYEHLGFEDALFRKHKKGIFGTVVPEFNHIYPTYRFHVKRGLIAPADLALAEALRMALFRSVDISKPYLVFAPLATGNHVDHCLVRDVCAKQFKDIVYWNDIPYSKRNPIDKVFLTRHDLAMEEARPDAQKANSIEAYASQWKRVFEGMQALEIPEQYAFRKEGAL